VKHGVKGELMAAVGRITGPLLKANLNRDGVDLAFETDLLYLDVTNARIGVNKTSPTTAIDVNGTTRTTNAIVNTLLTVGNLNISGNTISSTSGTISFAPSGTEATVYHSKLQVDELQITGNTISTFVSNSNLELRPNGSGQLNIVGNTNITGNLNVTGNINATGNITIGGNIQIGDQTTDSVVINAGINSNLLPATDNTYNLGSQSFRWRSVYAANLYADVLNTASFSAGNINFTGNTISTPTGQSLYIDGNGSGGVRLGNFRIVDNVITNVVTNAVSEIQHSGTGYFKISGTNGFVFPKGTDATRPSPALGYATIPTGMTRYNTSARSLEVWDGFSWSSPAGASGAVSEILANSIAVQFVLTLG